MSPLTVQDRDGFRESPETPGSSVAEPPGYYRHGLLTTPGSGDPTGVSKGVRDRVYVT